MNWKKFYGIEQTKNWLLKNSDKMGRHLASLQKIKKGKHKYSIFFKSEQTYKGDL